MHFNQLTNNRKTKAGSGSCENERMLAAEETFKDARLIFGRNSDAIILNIHLHFAILLVDVHTDGPIVGCVVIGIIYEITQDLPDTLAITNH